MDEFDKQIKALQEQRAAIISVAVEKARVQHKDRAAPPSKKPKQGEGEPSQAQAEGDAKQPVNHEAVPLRVHPPGISGPALDDKELAREERRRIQKELSDIKAKRKLASIGSLAGDSTTATTARESAQRP